MNISRFLPALLVTMLAAPAWAQSAGKPEVCPATCGCVVTGAAGAGLLAPAMNGTMTPEQSTSWDAIVQTCLPGGPGAGGGKT